jgi:trimeric autotransporter adhesin
LRTQVDYGLGIGLGVLCPVPGFVAALATRSSRDACQSARSLLCSHPISEAASSPGSGQEAELTPPTLTRTSPAAEEHSCSPDYHAAEEPAEDGVEGVKIEGVPGEVAGIADMGAGDSAMQQAASASARSQAPDATPGGEMADAPVEAPFSTTPAMSEGNGVIHDDQAVAEAPADDTLQSDAPWADSAAARSASAQKNDALHDDEAIPADDTHVAADVPASAAGSQSPAPHAHQAMPISAAASPAAVMKVQTKPAPEQAAAQSPVEQQDVDGVGLQQSAHDSRATCVPGLQQRVSDCQNAECSDAAAAGGATAGVKAAEHTVPATASASTDATPDAGTPKLAASDTTSQGTPFAELARQHRQIFAAAAVAPAPALSPQDDAVSSAPAAVAAAGLPEGSYASDVAAGAGDPIQRRSAQQAGQHGQAGEAPLATSSQEAMPPPSPVAPRDAPKELEVTPPQGLDHLLCAVQQATGQVDSGARPTPGAVSVRSSFAPSTGALTALHRFV